MIDHLPERFGLPYQKIAGLQAQARYRGAFVFGSVARGEATADSDFDVRVVTDVDRTCTNINHPFVGGVKIDITFLSLPQLIAFTDQEINRGERIPMIAESIIVFDKDGGLTALKQRAQTAQPRQVQPGDIQNIQFMAYHADNKVTRQLNTDPAGALLSMGIGLNELIRLHYRIRGRWQVSDKRLLHDLARWDAPLVPLLRDFALASDVDRKYGLWEAIIDYILAPLGGRQPIIENNCQCEQCLVDLANFS